MALTRSGELLKTNRLKKNLTLADVERGTRIRSKFLQAIEEGDLSSFHSLAYARGFIKNYAEFLKLDQKLVLAIFRRETDTSKVKIIPAGLMQGSGSLWKITPTRAIIAFALFILFAIGYYFFQEYRGFLGNPNVTVEKPIEQALVKEGDIEVAGSADTDATVLVNGEPVTTGENGKFTKVLHVFKGDTTITVVAKNRRGKETDIIRHIKVE